MRLSCTITRYDASNIGCTNADTERKMEEGKAIEEGVGEGKRKVEEEKKGKREGEKEWKVK